VSEAVSDQLSVISQIGPPSGGPFYFPILNTKKQRSQGPVSGAHAATSLLGFLVFP
jgi:hypothetical protein